MNEVLSAFRWVSADCRDARRDDLRSYVRARLQPTSESELSDEWYFIFHQRDQNQISSLTGMDPLVILREHLLNVDEWKYPYLLKIDAEMRGKSAQESLADWGSEYPSFVESKISDLRHEGSYDDIRTLIGEVEDAVGLLGLDFNDELWELEELANERSEPDEEETFESKRDTNVDDRNEMSLVDSLFDELRDRR